MCVTIPKLIYRMYDGYSDSLTITEFMTYMLLSHPMTNKNKSKQTEPQGLGTRTFFKCYVNNSALEIARWFIIPTWTYIDPITNS